VLSSSDAHTAAGLIHSFNLVLSETVGIHEPCTGGCRKSCGASGIRI
jgi:hypothetical protein